ncbi:uncharacterized protein LOC123540482 [Mercenaria mercenaria]|uniref:uncharacterized protein LOC123540482 n=1 Tax=Mercenaria mercenaria TaxID=6596 RepID=UPI001E1E00DE|nr:uncharacterized protein LOC123540482 [Mercenaria mercenaria]
MADDDFFGSKPDVTKELIKTKVSNNSTRREYLRMKSEQALAHRQASSLHSITEEETSRKPSLVAPEEVIKIQQEEPEVTSFPFVDSVDGVTNKRNKKDVKSVEANENPGHKHGAKLCMLSAMVHMKVLANRRAKSIKQLRKNPRTTLDDKNANKDDSDDDEDEEDGPLSYLKNCRYLRGVKQDQELSIEDIFG